MAMSPLEPVKATGSVVAVPGCMRKRRQKTKRGSRPVVQPTWAG
ncbi:MAG: hypothetical protein Q4G59_07305 [Planctomycetia bacterium]|nr:hypothetical protein [Planctomycetia bacterium]